MSKVYNLQKLGARAVIVFDNDPKNHDLVTMGYEKEVRYSIDIPSIFVSHATGMRIANELMPAKVNLFKADEEWIAPILHVPFPLIVVFFLLMVLALMTVFIVLLKSCYRLRHEAIAGSSYSINNSGLLEPLNSNVVIVDGSTKEDIDDCYLEHNGSLFILPAMLESSNNIDEVSLAINSSEVSDSSTRNDNQQQQPSSNLSTASSLL